MRIFILGLGAQKAGTTWLFKQLTKSDRYAKGFSKEYHLFDALYLGSKIGAQKKVRQRIKNYSFHYEEDFVDKYEKVMSGFYDDVERYYDYFDEILGDREFTSDITPSYSGLPAERLAEIRDGFQERGINLKVVFLLREPISRLESAIKMDLRRAGTLRSTGSEILAEKIRKALNSPNDLQRSDYRRICSQIDSVFPADDVFYGFYETLFSSTEVERLGDFLSLPTSIFDVDERINASPRLFHYSEHDLSIFRSMADERYRFVAERFQFDLNYWDQAVLASMRRP